MADCKHEWVAEYYGDRCRLCGLFIPDGCGPWLPDTEEEKDATVYRRCEICGGEFWDGGYSCTCGGENED